MLLTQNYRPQTYNQLRQPQHQQQHSFPLHQAESLREQGLQQGHQAQEQYAGPLYQPASQPDFYPQHLDIDLDAEVNGQSISSSPVSTQSLLSQFSAAQPSSLPTFDGVPTLAVPRHAKQPDNLFRIPASSSAAPAFDDSSLLAGTDLMHHPDTWMGHGQLTPKSIGRLSHHRESSLSSLGSAGPASPYSQNTSNPHIAVTDSVAETYHGLPSHEDFNYQLAKGPHDNFYANYPNYTVDNAASSAYASMASASQGRRGERGLLPPPDYPIGPHRSRPVSVASSVASDSPATPSLGEPEDDRRRRTAFGAVPKLDRTMTDVYSDELYSPNFTITSAAPSQASQIAMSPSSDLFAQRLQAANSQHLNAVQSPVSSASRTRSPFRHGSPLAPTPSQEFPTAMSASHLRFGSAQKMREQRKAEQDAHALQQQLARGSDSATPQTISPKDAVLEFNEPEGEANFPLFPQHDSTGFDTDQMGKGVVQAGQPYDGLSLDGSSFNFVGSQLPTGLQVPQHYPFVAQPRQQGSAMSMSSGSMVPSRVSSAESGSSGSAPGGNAQRPLGTNADGGTYTCTYHGCALRFETPALLQKHKREGHRQAHGLNGARKAESSGMTSSLLNSQAGPHRCDRINPSTGKPCNTVFSRPYDLTRHEDTIHNARKQKVRCNLCTDEKTFSRADALTRHYRVCHPDMDLPGKHRRRAAQSS